MITTTQLLDAANVVSGNAYKEEVKRDAKAIHQSSDPALKKASATLAKIYIHQRLKSRMNEGYLFIGADLHQEAKLLHDHFMIYASSIATAYTILKAIHGHMCPFAEFFSLYRLLRVCEWPEDTFYKLDFLDIEALGSMSLDEFNRLIANPHNWMEASND